LPHALVAGFTRGFAVAAAFAAAAAVVALLTISRDVGRTDRVRDTAALFTSSWVCSQHAASYSSDWRP
jgi:hypothetical protein